MKPTENKENNEYGIDCTIANIHDEITELKRGVEDSCNIIENEMQVLIQDFVKQNDFIYCCLDLLSNALAHLELLEMKETNQLDIAPKHWGDGKFIKKRSELIEEIREILTEREL